ncbi:DUF1292 domain-containing protein [Psychrobacillus sp. NPDC058041]|uniref:DUF1292 domain-containing protein n=1 Tax=Psychrobacillus sp. NPDC058041 TaxID=3346310 RepID=UPI0036DB1342
MVEKMGSIEVGDILSVMDSDNQKQKIEVIGLLTIEDKEYAAFAFADDGVEKNMQEVGVFFFRNVDGEELAELETEAEYEKVSATFLEALEAG